MKRALQIFMISLGLTVAPWQTAYGIYRILPYPLSGQEKANWCWAANDQMLRCFFMDCAQQCEIANFGLGRSDCCPSASAPAGCDVPSGLTILEMPWKYSISHTAGHISYSDIRFQLVNRGRPVIYTFKYVGSSVGHVRTITGVYDDSGQWLLANESLPIGVGSYVWVPYVNYVGSDAIGYKASNTYHNIRKL